MNSECAFSFLGMAILFDYKKKIIKIDNSLYIKQLSDTYGIKDDNTMPYGQNFMSSDPQDIAMSDIRKYKSLVMSLFYVAKRTRPDILFAVSYLATRSSEPTQNDYDKALRILSYLNTTRDIKLTLKCDNQRSKRLVFAFVDASYAIHPDMKGHSGTLIFDECGNLLHASSS